MFSYAQAHTHDIKTKSRKEIYRHNNYGSMDDEEKRGRKKSEMFCSSIYLSLTLFHDKKNTHIHIQTGILHRRSQLPFQPLIDSDISLSSFILKIRLSNS